MEILADKCSCIGTGYNNLSFDCLYHLNNIKINQCSDVSDLGITIYSDFHYTVTQ